MKRAAPGSQSSPNKKTNRDFSTVLKSIIGQTSIDCFLKDTYQLCPSLYHVKNNDDTSSVLNAIYAMGWGGVTDLLHKSQINLNTSGNQDPVSFPLFFRNQEPVQLEEIKATYGNSPFAAYLDGCSIINNHADLLLPSLANLCLDIQQSLPHAYVNTYLTPPNAAAVNAHADDRDVFVIQIMGEKEWKVYGDVPIPYPSTKEQVGKNGVPVPKDVLQKQPLYEVTLKQGDVLYMPRGFVHEASTSSTKPSFHATVAFATHDWSLSKSISELVTKELESSTKFRMALHPEIGMRSLECVGTDIQQPVQDLIKDAMENISQKINLESIANHLAHKYRTHNQFVESKRQALCKGHVSLSPTTLKSSKVVGPEAARLVQLSSKVRAGTPEEKASVPPPISTHGRGLTVREETFDPLILILSTMKNNVGKCFEVCTLRQEILNLDGAEMICDLTLLSFVKCCVELGAMALAP